MVESLGGSNNQQDSDIRSQPNQNATKIGAEANCGELNRPYVPFCLRAVMGRGKGVRKTSRFHSLSIPHAIH